MSPTEALRLQADGAVLVDVREHAEWEAGHAPGAMHTPLRELVGALGQFHGIEVLAVCRSGNRSATAAQVLAAGGIRSRNVAGGMKSWAARGLPIVRGDGSPGAVA